MTSRLWRLTDLRDVSEVDEREGAGRVLFQQLDDGSRLAAGAHVAAAHERAPLERVHLAAHRARELAACTMHSLTLLMAPPHAQTLTLLSTRAYLASGLLATSNWAERLDTTRSVGGRWNRQRMGRISGWRISGWQDLDDGVSQRSQSGMVSSLQQNEQQSCVDEMAALAEGGAEE